MRFSLLSQEEELHLAEEGGDGLSHLPEFIPSPLFTAQPLQLTKGESLHPGKNGNRRQPGKQRAFILPLSARL